MKKLYDFDEFILNWIRSTLICHDSNSGFRRPVSRPVSWTVPHKPTAPSPRLCWTVWCRRPCHWARPVRGSSKAVHPFLRPTWPASVAQTKPAQRTTHRANFTRVPTRVSAVTRLRSTFAPKTTDYKELFLVVSFKFIEQAKTCSFSVKKNISAIPLCYVSTKKNGMNINSMKKKFTTGHKIKCPYYTVENYSKFFSDGIQATHEILHR